MPATPREDVNLIGYILPEKKVIRAEDADLDANEEEEEEEEKQPEFLDMEEMLSVSSGQFNMFDSSIPAKNEVDFQDYSGSQYRVEGRFPLRDPWWEVTCIAGRLRKGLILQGYPSFKLRSGQDRAECLSLVSLFLTACGVTPEFITQFSEWLPADRDVGFSNLLEVLTEFEDLEQNTAGAREIKSQVSHSAAGRRVQAASLYPLVMRYLPTLLPAHFPHLLGKAKGSERQPATQASQRRQNIHEEVDHMFLSTLEETIRTDVWKLGFNYIMYKELNLVRCEAKLKAFDECGLIQKIPLPQRNALRVYDQLKRSCYRSGSTYMDLQALCEAGARNDHLADQEVWEAVHLLQELGVVVRERKKVAIRNLFSYETGIAKCLRAVVEGEPWHIPLDASKVLHAAAEERIKWKKGGAADVQDPDGGGGSASDRADEMGGDPADTDPGGRNVAAAACEQSASTNGEPCSNGSRSAQTAAEPGSARTEQDPGPFGSDQVHVQLDPDQVRAAEMICANPVTVISGKGGCGKTTVVSAVFKAAMEQQKEEVKNACWDLENDSGGSESWGNSIMGERGEAEGTSASEEKEEVLLTAPTGRAAALLTKKTCFTAYTLHQVLWSFMCTKKDEEGSPVNWKFESVRVLVVDEGSLVCVQLLHSVLTMLTRHARLQKFIILGDIRQLPSIQPGNTLHDLFHSLKQKNWAIEMKTNHRAESELIVKNAGLISDMGMKHRFCPLEFDAILDLSKTPPMPSADKSFIFVLLPTDNESDLYAAITYLLKGAPGLQSDTTSQFIAFRRADCAMINDICCKHYSNHLPKNHKKSAVFQPGDKVCCTKNGYVTDQDKATSAGEDGDHLFDRSMARNDEEKDKHKLRLCNGEIFFISGDNTITEQRQKSRYLTLDDRDGRVLTLSYRELQRCCRIQHAWARTIHTFQGSETETIVYVLGKHSGAQTWKHVYTAVTRGQKRVYVVANRDGLAAAVKRRDVPRNTRLGGLVRELLAEPRAEAQGSPGPLGSSQPGTPRGAAPGSGSSPSTPLFPPTPSCSRVASARSSPIVPRCLWKDDAQAVKGPIAPDVTVLSDAAFSEAYTWSPMNSPLEKQETEHDVTSEASHAADNGQLASASATLLTGSPGNKRTLGSPHCDTPKKQLKVVSSESPLGCSKLQHLSLHTPKAKAPRGPPSDRPSVRQPVFTITPRLGDLK